MQTLTRKQLQAVLTRKHNVDFLDYLAFVLSNTLPKYNIDTKLRASSFIAQCAHESSEFTALAENLNYSAARLVQVFKRVTPEVAKRIAGRPEAIGNYLYANRNGNGPELSGDGYRYRGRGAIQLTGRANYERVGKAIGLDLLLHPEILETLPGAVEAACAYWVENKLNIYADQGDMNTLTKKINGGLNGLEDRKRYYQRALEVL